MTHRVRSLGLHAALILIVTVVLGASASVADDPGTLVISSFAITDDGTADPICIAGDPNPLNAPGLAERCPGRTDAECDTPGQPGSGVCRNVPDGFADRGETVNLQLLLFNASVVAQTGSPRTLTNLIVGIQPNPASVACVRRGQVYLGTVRALARTMTPAGALSIVLDPAAASLPDTMQIEITAQADAMAGLQPVPAFSLKLGSDWLGSDRIAASCPGNPAANAEGVLCEDFDTERNGTSGLQFTRLPVGTDPFDPLRALGDPNDDILGYTQGTGVSPAGTGAVTCLDDAARNFADCVAVPEENDWHLHSPLEGPGAGYDSTNTPGIGAPDGGKALSGQRSMHWGRHLNPTSTAFDTIRLRQVAAFVLDPPVNIGPLTSLDFWHIIQVLDDELIDAPTPVPGLTYMGGQVQISLLGDDGRFERWRTLSPSFNPYNSVTQDNTAVCQFDPGDDDLPPTNETMCEISPLWSDMGDVFGNDATCLTDTDGSNYTDLKDCGEATSCTPGNTAGCASNGNLGSGVWVRSAFDLSPFAGREARMRWVGTTTGGWGYGINRSPMEPEPGQPYYIYYEKDDGWWIDDIKLTDLRVGLSTLEPDPDTGLAACIGMDPLNCGVINILVTGSITGPNGVRLLGVRPPSPQAPVDARPSVAGDDPMTGLVEGRCDFGMLQFQFSELDDAGNVVNVISPFSSTAQVQVAPSRDTRYRIEAFCSSDPACAASQEVLMVVYSSDGSDIQSVEVTGGANSLVGWLARPQPTGILGYDVFRFASGPASGVDPFPGNIFSGSCWSANVGQIQLGLVGRNDSDIPAAGTTFMYQVSHSSQTAGAINPLGVRPPASPHAGQVMMAGTACP